MASREVIALLECYLRTAREHPFGHVAISMVGHPGIAACDIAGDVSLQLAQQEALGLLGGKLDDGIANWRLPLRDESLDASHAVFNCAHGPLGFDFVVWLVDAEMARIRAGAPAPLKVAFYCGRDGLRATDDRRREWLENVFRPSLKFIGAVEDDKALRGHHKAVYVQRDIVMAAKRGEKVPRLKAVEPVNVYGGVTITLREADHLPHRNSNLDAWFQFARYLQNEGERVVFIRDFGKADEPFHDFLTAPRAARDIVSRMALYESARANLFISNGPGVLAIFGSRAYLQFARLEKDGPPSFREETPAEFWKTRIGISPGEQYPWSAPNQRIIWKPDTFENMKTAWEDLAAMCPNALGQGARPAVIACPS